MKPQIYRIIDANLNRSREGLRVCEEAARLVLNDKPMTDEFRRLRHGITGCIKRYPEKFQNIILSRDSNRDVGSGEHAFERERGDWKEVCLANMERVKESLRVLEEFSKLIDIKIAVRFKKLRFRTYGIEKKLISRF
ncbi:MAG: thiamine-phosphate pyrophosphorylase [Candidatus Omnitrophota bacterium]